MGKKNNPTRRRKRRRASKGRPGRNGGEELSFVTGFLADGNVTSSVVAQRDLPALQTYLDAHDLLPPGFDAGPSCQPAIVEALGALEAGEASGEALLRAIVVLGHTPSSAALNALRRHARSRGNHAAVARMAIDECVGWMSQEQAAVGPLN